MSFFPLGTQHSFVFMGWAILIHALAGSTNHFSVKNHMSSTRELTSRPVSAPADQNPAATRALTTQSLQTGQRPQTSAAASLLRFVAFIVCSMQQRIAL